MATTAPASQTAKPRWQRLLQAGRAAATDLLFPPRCTSCDAECPSRPDRPLWCAACQAELAPSSRPTCPWCAMTCPEADAATGPCPQCRGAKLLYAAARALGPYDGPLRQAVLRIKHARYEPLADGLGMQLAQCIRERPFPETPNLVAAVPMFWLQRSWRGINGPEAIARGLARELSLPVAGGLLVCRRWLQKQSSLRPVERRRNVRGAFRASWRYRIREARVLLVDDVMTTGATAQEAARALRQAGAAAVYVAAVARSTHEF